MESKKLVTTTTTETIEVTAEQLLAMLKKAKLIKVSKLKDKSSNTEILGYKLAGSGDVSSSFPLGRIKIITTKKTSFQP